MSIFFCLLFLLFFFNEKSFAVSSCDMCPEDHILVGFGESAPICKPAPCPETSAPAPPTDKCRPYWDGNPAHPLWRDKDGFVMRIKWPHPYTTGDQADAANGCRGIFYGYAGGLTRCLITAHDTRCGPFQFWRYLDKWDPNSGPDEDGDGEPDGECVIRVIDQGDCTSIPVKVDHAPPSCNVNYLGPKAWTNGSVSVTAQCVEPCYCGDPGYNSGCTDSGLKTYVISSNGCHSIPLTVKDKVGNVGTCPNICVYWIDQADPYAIYSRRTYAANHQATLHAITFGDLGTPPGLTSGLKSISVEIENSAGGWSKYTKDFAEVLYPSQGPISETIIPISHDFSKVGTYGMKYEVCDQADNCVSGSDNSMYTIVPNNPVFRSGECNSSYNYGLCPSKFTHSPDPSTPIIADGKEAFTTQIELHDTYGNLISADTKVKFFYENSTALDQITEPIDRTSETNDSSLFRKVLPNGNMKIDRIESRWDMRPVPDIRTSSYAPTSSGYPPITGDGFYLKLDSIKWEYNPGVIGVFDHGDDYDITPDVDFAWQSRFHDHVIRDINAYDRIAEYIRNNPANWQ